jgi:acyl-CoA thioesterase FadM
MTLITITLTDVIINQWIVDAENQNVTVHYRIVDQNGDIYQTGHAIFWVTIPDLGVDHNGNPIPMPDNWYQLPAEYVTTLADLTADARLALLHLVNETE